MARPCMPTRIAEPLLHDPEDLDLLVGRQPHLRIHVELDLQLAVCREQLDVAAKCVVEPRRSSGRRECEDCKARLLLRGRRRSLETRQNLVEGGTVLVRGCEFREDKPQIELGEGVRRAVISDNVFTGAARIASRSKGSVQIGNNAGE